MPELQYKLEYFKGAAGPTDEGVYIQIRTEVPAYQHIITKEIYYSSQNTSHSDFCNHLFAVNGVVRVSSQAWRVYIEKSPVFKWDEILPGVLNVIMTDTGCNGLTELPGSGLTLSSQDDRRSF